MALTLTSQAGASNNTDLTQYTTASFTPSANALLIAIVQTVKTATPTQHPTLSSSHSLTTGWTSLLEHDWKTSGNTFTLSLWAAVTGASPGASAVTIDYAGVTVIGGDWSIFDVTGGPTTSLGPGAGAAIVQLVNTVPNLANATSVSLTLAAAADTGNRPVSGWGHNINEGQTPRAGWTELHDLIAAGPSRDVETQWNATSFDTTASSSWATSSQTGGFAFELNSVIPAAPSAPPQFRSQQSFF